MAFDILLNAGEIPLYAPLVDDRVSLALVGQRVKRRLQTFAGEWYLQTGRGLPFREWSSVKPAPLDLITEKVREEIKAVPGVRAILSLVIDFDDNTRKVVVSGRVLCDVGILDLKGAAPSVAEERAGMAVPWVAVFAGVPTP